MNVEISKNKGNLSWTNKTSLQIFDTKTIGIFWRRFSFYFNERQKFSILEICKKFFNWTLFFNKIILEKFSKKKSKKFFSLKNQKNWWMKIEEERVHHFFSLQIRFWIGNYFSLKFKIWELKTLWLILGMNHKR